MKSEGASKKRVYIILAVMICLQLASIIYYFQFRKEGYHSDEMWSYGYANSYYLKDIYQDNKGEITYVEDWYDTNVLRDYIVVNEGEEFAYDSIYRNQIYDLSPPFHSMVLHTICSFFLGEFSKWFSFAINIASFLVGMFFLFKIASLLKDEWFALCCCTVYGFSMGARDTFVYLRMYALCTAFTMIILYNILRLLQKYRDNHKLCWYNMVAILTVSVMGFLTHYYMVSYMGILTFLICAYTFVKREFKFTFGFGFLMLAAFIISSVIFPAMFMVAEGKASTEAAVMDYDFRIRFIIIAHYMMMRLFNIALSAYPSGVTPIVIGIICFLFIVCIPLFVLLRDTQFVKKSVKRIKLLVFHPIRILKYVNRRINWIYIILALSIVLQIIVVGETSSVFGMGNMIDRYIFFIFPITVIVVMGFIYQLVAVLLRKSRRVKWVMLIICFYFVGINVYNSATYFDYLFLRHGEVNIEDVIRDKNCIYLRYLVWMTTTMAPTLMEADQFAQLQFYDYEKIQNLYEQKKDEELIVIIDTSFMSSVEHALDKSDTIVLNKEGETKAEKMEKMYNDIIQYLEDLEPETKMEHLTTQTIFTRNMEVYLVNP